MLRLGRPHNTSEWLLPSYAAISTDVTVSPLFRGFLAKDIHGNGIRIGTNRANFRGRLSLRNFPRRLHLDTLGFAEKFSHKRMNESEPTRCCSVLHTPGCSGKPLTITFFFLRFKSLTILQISTSFPGSIWMDRH